MNLESVRDLSRIVGLDLDPLRFRANVYIEGVPAWEELHWLGKTISCGSAMLRVFKGTTRCEGTSVDLNGRRGLSIPSALECTWGH